MLKNECLLAKIGFDTAENEHRKGIKSGVLWRACARASVWAAESRPRAAFAAAALAGRSAFEIVAGVAKFCVGSQIFWGTRSLAEKS